MRSSALSVCRRCLNQISATGRQRSLASPLLPIRSSSSHSKSPPLTQQTPSKRHRPSAHTRTASSLSPREPQSAEELPEDEFAHRIDPILSQSQRVLLTPDNLFHSFTNSPSPGIRRRAAYIKQHAYCPHPSHQRTRSPVSPDDTENRKPPSTSPSASPPAHVRFECPDCGIPVSCSEAHWADDYEAHLPLCDTLREINEDDHDLRSGRFFPEFEYPGPQRADEFVVNMSNWDTFLYTRDFPALDDMRNMRHVTRLMTYPATIASVLHELSPYTLRHRLTMEGLRSLSALRYTLHPPPQGEGGSTVRNLRPKPPPARIFILGARAEAALPRAVWLQLTHCFPRHALHLVFVGPDAMAGRPAEWPLPERTAANPFGGVVEGRLGPGMKITTFVDYFHTMYEAGTFAPFDPYFDAFVLFHPGLGHPASAAEWSATLPQLLETKCPVICTGYTAWDMERDRRWVLEQTGEGREMDVLLEPGENIFRSLRWDLNDLDPVDVTCGNWGLWAFRGKRYEAVYKDPVVTA